jgi:TRAP transporter TAXI family solute receptor
MMLKGLGLQVSTVQVKSPEFSKIGETLRTGNLDALIARGSFSAVVAEAVRSGARPIPISGRSADLLQNEYPFLRKTAIPSGKYPGVGPLPTVGVDVVLVCRRTIGEGVIHELTTRMFEAIPSLPATVRSSMLDFDEMSATPIPLHEGAARYYREQELRR